MPFTWRNRIRLFHEILVHKYPPNNKIRVGRHDTAPTSVWHWSPIGALVRRKIGKYNSYIYMSSYKNLTAFVLHSHNYVT